MATSKPRITVTLEPEVYETISGLAEIQGRSMSSIVSELLTMVNPVQQKVLAAVQRAMNVQESSKASLISQLEKGQEEAEMAIGPLLKMLDDMGTLPPHSNTGVTNLTPPANKQNENTGKALSRASGGEK
jgi:uncharacterized protein (DUF1778 family)